MLNKFQQAFELIMEDNAAGDGGAFGSPSQAVYGPPSNVNSSDSIASGDARYIYGGVFPATKSRKKSKKKNKKKSKKPLVIRRNLNRKEL